jgi:hypothetical protein
VPDRTDLDERLAGGRSALLADIVQPPMDQIGARAATIRRRRRQVRGATALAVVAVGAFLVRPDGGEPAPQVAQPPPPSAPVYAGDNLTINGLPDLAHALDLPGTVVDMEFVDAEHGYAVSTCGGTDAYDCRPSFASTADGGRTWAPSDLPSAVGTRTVPALVAFAPHRVLVRIGTKAYSSADSGQNWRETIIGELPTPMQAGDILQPHAVGSAGYDCGEGRVDVWTPDFAPRGPLARQPDLAVCWVVPAGGDGRAWWVGGRIGPMAAIAVTRDRGLTWATQSLPVAGSARVAVLGPHVYVLVSEANGRLRAVFHSADRGLNFSLTGESGLPSGVAGDPVPLLDGRLLIADPSGGWWISADDGRTFKRAGGTLPVVGRLARTPAGYVAYDLFHADWLAFSTDGSTWRKQDLR